MRGFGMSERESEPAGDGERTALVTGGTRGIGFAVSKRLAAEGFSVVMNYVSDDDAAREALDVVDGAELAKFDVSDPGAVSDALESREIDVLVNNAGITRDAPLVRMDDDQLRDVVETNLYGAIHCTRELLPGMMRQRYGRVVNVASVAGERGSRGQSNYAASKSGLLGFTRSVAREVASRNVTVNAVSPGYVRTDMTGEVDSGVVEERVPVGKWGQPADVADAVAFVVGSGYVTGQVVRVDGGLHMA